MYDTLRLCEVPQRLLLAPVRDWSRPQGNRCRDLETIHYSDLHRWRMLTYADVCWRMSPKTTVSVTHTIYIYISVRSASLNRHWRMPTYADVCWRMQGGASPWYFKKTYFRTHSVYTCDWYIFCVYIYLCLIFFFNLPVRDVSRRRTGALSVYTCAWFFFFNIPVPHVLAPCGTVHIFEVYKMRTYVIKLLVYEAIYCI